MTPDYRAALYAVIENAIDTSSPADPLFEAAIPRTSRGRVDAKKTVKIVSGPGRFNYGAESGNRATDVLFTVQCWVAPDAPSDSEENLEAALDLAMAMSEQVFNAIKQNESLGGTVCSGIIAEEYDAEFASHGGMLKAAAYLDGTINPAAGY